MTWTDEMKAGLRKSLNEGLPARQIAEALGVTRNAVLGQTFRMGLKAKFRGRPPARPIPKTRAPKHRTANQNIRDLASRCLDTIMDMRDNWVRWEEIASTCGITVVQARTIAIEYGGYIPKSTIHFTDEEIIILIQDYKAHVPVEDIADKLGRSYGVIRQKVVALTRMGLLNRGDRDPARTRLLRQYGEKALEAGKTPSEALRNIAEAKIRAFAEASYAARRAASHRRSRAIETMMSDIAAGVERNEAIFRARADGAHLDEIGDMFNITRERVRQICTKQAELIALQKLVGEK